MIIQAYSRKFNFFQRRNINLSYPLKTRTPLACRKQTRGVVTQLVVFNHRTNVPFLYSSKAARSSSSVFITIGPRQAMGS